MGVARRGGWGLVAVRACLGLRKILQFTAQPLVRLCVPEPIHIVKDKAIFQDEQGRGWLVEVQYGHPAPTERGIYAARFRCPDAPE